MERILVVDDSRDSQLLVEQYLRNAEVGEIILAETAFSAMDLLNKLSFDLILMDIMMPGMNGIEACRQIKTRPELWDVPVIMVTAKSSLNDLEQAFESGAFDYITKPLEKVELLARVKSALKLKREIDRRKFREEELLRVKQELEQINEKLRQLSFLDPLTGLCNRRYLDSVLTEYWEQKRDPLSFIMIDIDCFKAYNDAYGHQQGDTCLTQVARILESFVRAPGFVARYGGEEFAVVLPEMDFEEAKQVANSLCRGIESLAIPHEASQVAPVVTVSVGLSFAPLAEKTTPRELIALADQCLYQSKAKGRNQVTVPGKSEH